jgi:Arc/MetJ-type ribon-helix-helix transcriptional regulator
VIHRQRKISFRLDPTEEQRYSSMVDKHWGKSWSRVIRTALREMWERKQKAESDNLAAQEARRLSDTRSAVGQGIPVGPGKARKGRKKLAK